MLRCGVDQIAEAAEAIKSGKLVAFPTETVYGLGADAFNPQAVAAIYAAKGRPGDNPLILHIADPADFNNLAENPPQYTKKLIEKFWPGALTLVVKKKPNLPAWLGGHPSGQTETIGIRIPANPIAQAIIKASGCVVAAPSANTAGRPSPTTAQHVLDDFASELGIAVIDGGSVNLGIESAVVDATGETPVILRPGQVTADMIQAATGINLTHQANQTHEKPRSPGMKYRHYAPKAPMTILKGTSENIAAYIKQDKNICILTINDSLPQIQNKINLGNNPEEIAQNLYAALRKCDKLGVTEIYAQAVAEEGLGIAIMDRMLKAAEGRMIHVGQ